jgi:hypothetical protein
MDTINARFQRPVHIGCISGREYDYSGALEDLWCSRSIPGGYKVKPIFYGDVDVTTITLALTRVPTAPLVVSLER